MRLTAVFMLAILTILAVFSLPAAALPSSSQLAKQIEQLEANNSAINQSELIAIHKNTLRWLNEYDTTVTKSTSYENAINNFATLSLALRQELEQLDQQPEPVINPALSATELEQQISQVSSKLLEISQQILQEQENFREIVDSVNQIPQKQALARRLLSDAEQRLYSKVNNGSTMVIAEQNQLQAEVEARKAMIAKLSLEQLSANNRQELSRIRIDILKRQYDQADQLVQQLRNRLNTQRQFEAQQTLETAQSFVEKNTDLPESIRQLIETNAELSLALNQQASRLNDISLDQRTAVSHTIQVRQAMSTLQEQAEWLSMSTALGETLRLQLAKLPGKPKPQQLDREMADVRLQRLNYESQLTKLEQKQARLLQNTDEPLSPEQKNIAVQLIKNQRELLNALLTGCDSLILELTHLKVSNSQLIDALDEIQETSHRYFFWVADVNPLNLDYPVNVAKSLTKLITLNTLSELAGALVMMLTTPKTLSLLLMAVAFVVFGLSLRKPYFAFLDRTANKVGKVTKDDFTITLRTVFWSVLIALPLPVLWAAIGYGLQNAWDYPIAVAIGSGVNAASPILWVFMICASFSHPQGLFIAHFNWSAENVGKVMRYYQLSVWVVIPLVIAVMSFDSFNDHEFAGTLGRLSFILLCIALILMTYSLHKAKIPLQLDRKGAADNILNTFLWGILLSAPWLAIIAASVGYLRTSQVLLGRLEASAVMWFGLLLIYYIIRRWMLIQRRRIAFDRAKQRRAERLAQRAKTEDENSPPTPMSNTDSLQDIDEPVVDLDTISAQSLQLVRSILAMIALVSVILLWSELHSAFAFLENINLWSVKSISQGVEILQKITLGSILIAILVLIITAQLVRNLPALLELAILQHLDLTPGTGYAISTLTKYIILLFGGLLAFSLIGVDWSTLQWLIAALGVGLGFGLQEIFANFISGLIILFEKPIRIGDTVTIRDLTGSVTKINTRATTIVDWDRKEIIVPNKAFITEQFINWSLSDSITRIVLTIPAAIDASSQLVLDILKEASEQCSYVLDNPQSDAFLVDIQEGIQLFELRVFAAEMAHRMPLRNELHQLIIAGYKKHDLVLPFPPFQVRIDGLGRKGSRRGYGAGGL